MNKKPGVVCSPEHRIPDRIFGLQRAAEAAIPDVNPTVDAGAPDSDLIAEFVADRAALLGFVFALTGRRDTAEEILQEVGLSIVTEARKGTRPTSFRAWVRQLARNRVADHYRQRAREHGRRSPMEDLGEVAARAFEENEEALDMAAARRRALADCTARLPDRAREIVALRYQQRMSLAVIAAQLSWQETSVKTALFRARRRLAECIRKKLRLQESV